MNALVHAPSPRMQACERTFVPHVPIDYDLALGQHAAYSRALRDCGCTVHTLDANLALPDCAFIEDTAVILDEVAVLGAMGASSRQSEPAGIESALREYREVVRLPSAATLEGGDVLRIGRTLLVGHSRRTNAAGIEALSAIAGGYGYRVFPVPVRGALHLKTACTALPDGRLLVNPAWIDESALGTFRLQPVPETEPWAANVAVVGEAALMSSASSQTAELVTRLGFAVTTVDLSEFAKAEGGVTCLALLISP